MRFCGDGDKRLRAVVKHASTHNTMKVVEHRYPGENTDEYDYSAQS
jgi:hypothetical protein